MTNTENLNSMAAIAKLKSMVDEFMIILSCTDHKTDWLQLPANVATGTNVVTGNEGAMSVF